MSGTRPAWRRGFDIVERAIGGRLETGAQTDGFADTLAVALKVQAEVRRRLHRAQSAALHAFNLPSHSDVHQLAQQIVRLERHVRELSRAVEAVNGDDRNEPDS